MHGTSVDIRISDTAAVRVKKLYNRYLDTLDTVCVCGMKEMREMRLCGKQIQTMERWRREIPTALVM